MTVVLDGRSLTLEEVVRVARGGETVELAPRALDAMRRARQVADAVVQRDDEAYGLTTGVGVHKRARVEAKGHDRLLVNQHLIAQGPPAPADVVRATALRLANALAHGSTVARPELAEHLVARLNDDRLPEVRRLGSVGQSDLGPMADLARGLIEDLEPERGEAIVLLNQSAFATGWAALAVRDALDLLDVLDVAGALDLEAFGCADGLIDPALGELRPYPGLQATLRRLRTLVEGSERPRRNLQDPLVFRTLPGNHGAARDAFGFVERQLAVELNTAQTNPVVTPDGRVVSLGGFEILPLATALDLARLALGPVLSSATERAVKLLTAPLTGLPEGLGVRHALAESALSELGIAIQAFAAEARLLALPVSLELVSTTQAEGIEDRTTMAPLAARRLAEMVDLGARVVAVELVIAAQACDLRGAALGAGTERARALVRSLAPFVGEGDPLPDFEPLVELVRSGEFGRVG